jgi:hypothetical protein
MNKYDLCKGIAIESLPHEEEPGLPHKPNLQSLAESAEERVLCHTIFLAVQEFAAIIHNERTGETPNPYGFMTSVFSEEAGRHKFIHYTGYNDLDDDPVLSGPKSYTGPVYIDPFSVFENHEKLHPYLFGNWWKPWIGEKEQLIRLGVRIGTGPSSEEGLENTEERAYL